MRASHLVALDIGTNSVLTLVAGAREDGSFHPLHEQFRVTRLGEGAHPGGDLRPDAVARTLATVEEFTDCIRRTFPSAIGVAAATSAVRSARNRRKLVAACNARLGGTLHVLSGADEARTAFLGSTSDLPVDQTATTIDVGGGSTEVATGTACACEEAVSVPCGALRLTESFDLADGGTPERIEAARTAAREQLGALASTAHRRPDAADRIAVASGGTATSLAAWKLGLEQYDAARVQGTRIAAAELRSSAREVCTMTIRQRLALPCMTAGRAEIFGAGLLILGEMASLLNAPTVRISDRGLRYGLLRRLSEDTITPSWT